MRKNRWYNYFCFNMNCRSYAKKGLGNITSNGHDRNGARKFICTDCNKGFNETKGTPFYHKHLTKKEIVKISKQFVEKNSFRGIARATGHHLDTVRSLASDAAKHCEAVTDFLLKDVKLGTYEIDEFWNFVKKNKKTLPKTFSRTLSRVMRTVNLR